MDNNRVYSDDLIQKTDFAPIFRLTYLWLSVGVAIVFLGGYLLAASGALLAMYDNGILSYMPIFGLIGMLVLSSGVQRQIYTESSASKSMVYFILFSALISVMIGPVFLIYEASSISFAFILTGGIFFGMTAIGFITKKDLSGMGGVLYAALWGLILVSILGIFFRTPFLYLMISWFGVVIFSLYIAYDTNRLKRIALENDFDENPSLATKLAIVFALSLLLNIVNLFLYLLRIFGRRR